MRENKIFPLAQAKAQIRKAIVIKLGGSSLASESTLDELSRLISGYRARGKNVVVVHGGGPAINEELTQRGITWSFVNGQRVTTPEMIEVIDEVLGSYVNSAVVGNLKADGIPATGLSGANHEILSCSQLNEELGLVGQVDEVDAAAIVAALKNGRVPVIAPIGFANCDDGGSQKKFNVNADWAATKIAIALRAEKLIFLTDQNGVLDGKRDLVSRATPYDLKEMIGTGVVSGGMCTKVLAMIVALESGVSQVRVLNAGAASRMLDRKKIGTTLAFARERVTA
ncbi:MAG: acetylglutamate kinase [Proteobacteria bacterium]|nr:MAG: acetylglutamate kinase [Pseudomonadota bacterium]